MIISNLSRRALLYRSMRDFFILALTFSGCVASSIAQVTPGGMVSGNFLNNTTEGGGYQFQSFNFSRTLGIDYWSKRTASAEAFGDAQRLGVLKSLARASRGDNGNSQAVVDVGFQDNITISDPSRNGQAGTYVGTMRLEMDHAGHGSHDFNYYNMFGLAISSSIENARGAFEGFGSYAMFYRDYLGQPLDDVDVTLQFSIPFTFGTPFGIGAYMTSTAKTGFGGGSLTGGTPVSILHDATNTAEWGGTVAVLDNTNTALAPDAYTMTSGSGTDYAQAIPEPSTGALLAFSALSLLQLRRRRI
jgi:hypothetical protein